MSDPISDVFHYDGLDFWNPADSSRIDRVLPMLGLRPGARVLDIGCGKAELLVRLAERYGAAVVGIDRSSHALAQARAVFSKRAPEADAEFLEQEVAAFQPAAASFDSILWIGGPFVGADFAETMQSLTGWLKPGGSLLIGQGFWAQPPPAEYLAAVGFEAEELTDNAGVIECGLENGLRAMYCCVSSRDEWDHFEGTIHFNFERYAMEHPDDPDPRGRLEKGRTWFVAQQRWGRDTMGFGFYLFAKPLESR